MFEIVHVTPGIFVLSVTIFAFFRLVQIDQVAAVLHHEVTFGKTTARHDTPAFIIEIFHLKIKNWPWNSKIKQD